MTTPFLVHFGASIRLLDKRNAVGSLRRDFQVDRKLNGCLDYLSGQEKQNKTTLTGSFYLAGEIRVQSLWEVDSPPRSL